MKTGKVRKKSSKMPNLNTLNGKASSKTHKRRKILGRSIILSAGAGVLACICYFVHICFYKIFKIKEIEINGNLRYSEREIIEKISLKDDENLVLYSEKVAKEKLEKDLPYIESIEFNKKLPGKLLLTIKESEPAAVLEDGSDGFLIVNSSLKILEVSKRFIEKVVVIKGVELQGQKIGSEICSENEDQKAVLKDLMCSLKEADLIQNISEINVEDIGRITLKYQDRINLILGSKEEIGYKIATYKEILTSKMNGDERGELDLTSAAKDNKTYFRQER
ncbi:MAG: FtsQ-type POTRA domain-containing protein [Oscillospiraceae bacterium]|jgi:cell division septal protein FtsQ|nr:FtsQ-type POTRA domain-containing protein [Oscillospiraceae bacterium]